MRSVDNLQQKTNSMDMKFWWWVGLVRLFETESKPSFGFQHTPSAVCYVVSRSMIGSVH